MIVALLAAAGQTVAQVEPTDGQRTITPVLAQQPPLIDGRLDEALWSAAQWQEGFVQHKPEPGSPARARTRVAIAYDSEHIYAAFRCLNPGGAAANSSIAVRDGNMDQDNAITVYFDTFRTRRDCYYFSANSLGTQVGGRRIE